MRTSLFRNCLLKSLKLILVTVFFSRVNVQAIFCPIDISGGEQLCCHKPRFIDNSAFINCNFGSRIHKFGIDSNGATLSCLEYECFFKSNSFYERNQFNKNDLSTYMAAIANVTSITPKQKSNEWSDVLQNAIETCEKRVTEAEMYLTQQYLAIFAVDPFDCNVMFLSMMNCIYYEVFLNCPKTAWDESEL